MSDVSAKEALPAAAHEQRDEIGRLVLASWHGTGTAGHTRNGRWLVAVDGSDCALRAVAMAAQLAALEADAELDLLHVQSWLTIEAAESELPKRGWAATAKARALLDAASVRWRLHVAMGEPALEIVRLANVFASRAVVIGSRGLNAAESMMLGSAAYQVLHLSKLPVLLVR